MCMLVSNESNNLCMLIFDNNTHIYRLWIQDWCTRTRLGSLTHRHNKSPQDCSELDVKEVMLKITICHRGAQRLLFYGLWDARTSCSFPKERRSVSVCESCRLQMRFDNSPLSLLSPCCSDTASLAPSPSFLSPLWMCASVCNSLYVLGQDPAVLVSSCGLDKVSSMSLRCVFDSLSVSVSELVCLRIPAVWWPSCSPALRPERFSLCRFLIPEAERRERLATALRYKAKAEFILQKWMAVFVFKDAFWSKAWYENKAHKQS